MLARGAVLLLAFVAAAAAQDAAPPTPAGANLKNGGQRFDLDFLLRDGCHACVTVGLVKVAFDFDVNGKFVGTEIGRVRARR